jgi:undecaprenyl-diphosphatase
METRFLLALHAYSSPWLDAAFRLSHDLGTLYWFAPLVALVVLFHRRRGERGAARLWLLLGLTTYLLQDGLKRLVARPRPQLWPWLVAVDPHSFPSGHALASATFYPLLAYDLTRRHSAWVRAVAVGAAVLMGLWIGFGRLYLGVHWPTDVLAGWALGALQATVAVWRLRRPMSSGE